MVPRESHQEGSPGGEQGQQMGQELSSGCSWLHSASGLGLALETRSFSAAPCKVEIDSSFGSLVLGDLNAFH